MLLDWNKLVWYSDEELRTLDVAAAHLACAAGLPGSEIIDADRCVGMLDRIAGWADRYTEHCLAKGLPETTQFTEVKTRMVCLGTVVWKGAGIRYNPAKIPEDAPWALEVAFIHGAIYGEGGTCATLPIIYAAVGRRLGYPLKLVNTWSRKAQHLFCRWDGPDGTRFNVDVNDTGVSFPGDGYFRRSGGMDRRREKAGLFLKSQTPRQELAGFLTERAHRWRDARRYRPCLDARAWAVALSPENLFHLDTLRRDMNEWTAQLQAATPPGFPPLTVNLPRRRYPAAVPLKLEHYMWYLVACENLLRDPEWDGKWWARLRRGESLRSPTEGTVEFAPDGTCNLSFQFAAPS